VKRLLPPVLLLVLALLPTGLALAQPGVAAFTVAPGPKGAETYTLSLQILALMTALTLLPAGLLMMTAFTRIVIVLALLRQALGTMQTPSNQILIGLALFLTFFVMAPVFGKVYSGAVQPYMNDRIPAQVAVQRAAAPFRTFMLRQTRRSDLAMFMRISGNGPVDSTSQIPFSVLVPAFVTSELKTAFQIGFLIFIPFLVIDIVVASLLMSMGMIMLSPMLISLPFKILLFVLVGGWSLIMGTLASSFYM